MQASVSLQSSTTHVGGRRPQAHGQIPLRGTVAGFETRREDGLAPIAVGEALRRLTSKCGVITTESDARKLFGSLQVGARAFRGDHSCSTPPDFVQRNIIDRSALLAQTFTVSLDSISGYTSVTQPSTLFFRALMLPAFNKVTLSARCVQPLTMFLRSPPCRGGPGHSLRRIASG